MDEYLRTKGYGRKIDDYSSVFIDPTVTSGMIKSLAYKFCSFGMLREDWDSLRVDTMIGLLVQKFQDPILAAKLLKTGDKILLEGNDWNDTFWGVDLQTKHGRNMLGRILMNIRRQLINNPTLS